MIGWFLPRHHLVAASITSLITIGRSDAVAGMAGQKWKSMFPETRNVRGIQSCPWNLPKVWRKEEKSTVQMQDTAGEKIQQITSWRSSLFRVTPKRTVLGFFGRCKFKVVHAGTNKPAGPEEGWIYICATKVGVTGINPVGSGVWC